MAEVAYQRDDLEHAFLAEAVTRARRLSLIP
jgi:hypothetical protein